METSYDILVVILASALAVLLILSIIAVVFLIKVLKQLKKITDKAEHLADNIESVSGFFKKTAGPVAFGKLLANIVEVVREKHHKKGK